MFIRIVEGPIEKSRWRLKLDLSSYPTLNVETTFNQIARKWWMPVALVVLETHHEPLSHVYVYIKGGKNSMQYSKHQNDSNWFENRPRRSEKPCPKLDGEGLNVPHAKIMGNVAGEGNAFDSCVFFRVVNAITVRHDHGDYHHRMEYHNIRNSGPESPRPPFLPMHKLDSVFRETA